MIEQNTSIQKRFINVVCGLEPLKCQELLDWLQQSSATYLTANADECLADQFAYLIANPAFVQKVYFIPFPENSVHPLKQIDLAKQIVQIDECAKSTIVVITHSPYMLRALEVHIRKTHGIISGYYLTAADGKLTAAPDDDRDEMYQVLAKAFNVIEGIAYEENND